MSRGGCSELFGGFRLNKFGLEHKFPQLFVTPQCAPAIFYVAWTTFWSLFYATAISFEICYNSKTGAGYFTYLTKWSYLLQASLVFLDCIVTTFVYIKRKDILQGEIEESTWYIKLLWVLFNTNNVIAPMVTTMYYTLLDPALTHESINTHLLNTVYTVLTFLFCAKPVNVFHFYQPMSYALVYTAFTVVWHFTEHEPVYPLLDWDEPETTVKMMALAILVGVPLVHSVYFALYTFRKWVNHKKCDCNPGIVQPVSENRVI